MKFSDPKKVPSTDSMIAINLWKHNNPRLVTVINNKPWYKSTGRNSGHQGTWFFFGGVLEKKSERHYRGWMIKPTSLSVKGGYSLSRFFGSNTVEYLRDHSIRKLISFSRFGDIEKICISASLGGGFWLSSKGTQLKNYLHKNYPQYFLSDELINKVNESAKRSDLPLYTNAKEVNLWLREHDVSTVGILRNETLLVTP